MLELRSKNDQDWGASWFITTRRGLDWYAFNFFYVVFLYSSQQHRWWSRRHTRMDRSIRHKFGLSWKKKRHKQLLFVAGITIIDTWETKTHTHEIQGSSVRLAPSEKCREENTHAQMLVPVRPDEECVCDYLRQSAHNFLGTCSTRLGFT